MGVYPNLEEAMRIEGVTRKNIAETLEVRYATIIDKMRGKHPFQYREAELIKNKHFPSYQLEDLFSSKKNVG